MILTTAKMMYLRIVHDTLGIIESSIKILPLVSLEHVVLYTVQIPVVRGTTQGLDNLQADYVVKK